VGVGLADEREVRAIAEPLQIFEYAGFVLGPAALAIVIFNAQKHSRPRSPHVLRVEHVPEMQPACRSGSEAGESRQ
jgi:hypothetical protein